MHKLLIVDDEPAMLQIMAMLLRSDYELHTASNGQEAVAILEREAVDLVLSDLRMPGICGLEVLQTAKRLNPEARRILSTAFSDQNEIRRALLEIGFRVLPKPWQAPELLNLVQSELEDRLSR